MANFTNFNSGLSTGIDNTYLTQTPIANYVIYPKSIANSTTMTAQPISQSYQPTWVLNSSSVGSSYSALPNAYILKSQQQWAATFPTSTSGVQTPLYKGNPSVVFDVPRTVLLTFSSAINKYITVTVSGYDIYENAVVEQIVVNSGVTTVAGDKAFYIVTSTYYSSYPWTTSSTSNTVLVQGNNIFGLPYFVNSTTSYASVFWAQTIFSTVSKTNAGNVWRTTTPVPTSPDARGSIDLSSNSQLPNGATQLLVNFYAYGFDQKLNDQLGNLNSQPTGTATYNFSVANAVGNSSAIASLYVTGSGTAILPRLVDQDRFGAQFPQDLDFMTYYQNLKGF